MKTMEDWMQAMSSTRMTWTEEEVYEEYNKPENRDEMGTLWCQIMMAGILGSREKAVEKYPEMFI